MQVPQQQEQTRKEINMLGNFFDYITNLSLRFKWLTIGLTAVIIIADLAHVVNLSAQAGQGA